MIRIVIELWKRGNMHDVKVLASAIIANDGSGTITRGNYGYSLHSKGKKFRVGDLKGFEKKKKNVWWLLYYVLKDAIWEQQGEKEV